MAQSTEIQPQHLHIKPLLPDVRNPVERWFLSGFFDARLKVDFATDPRVAVGNVEKSGY